MIKYLANAWVCAAFALGGCAIGPETDSSPNSQATAAKPAEAVTGSRIPRSPPAN